MMNKLNLSLLAAAGVMLTGCSSDEPLFGNGAQDGMVTFNVTMPVSINSRAIADGLSATDLTYVVYNDADGILFQETKTAAFSGKQATVQIPLVNGMTYNVAFVATNQDAKYVVENGKLKMNYANGKVANTDTYDAFYKVQPVTVSAGMPQQQVTLTRPFAQVNVGATDWADAKKAGYVVESTTIGYTAQVYTELNLLDGTVDGAEEIEFTFNTLPDSKVVDGALVPATLTAGGNDYDYMAMTYVLVPEQSLTVNSLNFKYVGPNSTEYSIPVNSVPVQRNHRTNIVGKFFTTDVDYQIIIDEEFEKDDFDILIWDGKTAEEPTPDPSDPSGKTYTLSTPAQLAGFAQKVKEGDTFTGKTIKLDEDIDLGGFEWTPVGSDSKPFNGNFDGQGHTISNLKISGNDSSVGLFGRTNGGKIENVTVENAVVKGYLNVGVVAGTPYTTEYSNITVTGLIQIEGFSYTGGVFGKNVYNDLTDITINADPGSYVKTNSVDSNGTAYRTYVGGVVGFVGEGGHTIKNVTSNIDVIASTCDAGGIVGIAHYGNKFVNCSSSGNIKILAAPDESAYREIGGIAGVWHNQNGQTVEFTNCSFTGTLSSVMEDGTDRTAEIAVSNQIVGKAYGSDLGKGTLIIDGETIQSPSVYTIFTKHEFSWIMNKLAANGGAFYDQTVYLNNDVDLTGVAVPKMSGNGPYHLTFDGKNHALKNFTANHSGSAGLFSTSNASTYKNLVLEGATIVATEADDAYAGALVGKSYSGVYENITVKNCSVKGVNKVGGLIGFAAEDATYHIDVTNCHVIGSTVENFDRADEAGQLGGFIGYLQTVAKFNNCSVKNTTVKAYMNRADRYCNEFAGTFHGSDGMSIDFNDVVCEGNTFNLLGSNPVTPVYGKILGGNRIGKGVIRIDGAVK